MKKSIYKLSLVVLMLSGSFIQLKAQDDDPVLKQAVEAKRFVFMAQFASPLSGQQVRLTPEYTLAISGDSLIAGLPYFGKSYSAPANPANVSIDFVTTDYTYTSASKKGGWEITITPKDVSEVRQMYLDIYSNGRANLRVISNTRDGISYDGYVKAGK